jgi:hypothetical protein
VPWWLWLIVLWVALSFPIAVLSGKIIQGFAPRDPDDFSLYDDGMSTNPESRLPVIAETSRRLKTQLVHEHGDSPDESLSDLRNFCIGVRGGRQLFMVYHGPGPESARQCAYWSALFLNCDEIFQVADARFRMVDFQPSTDGLLPQSPEVDEAEFYATHPEVYPGSISEAWERGEREGIQESLQISRYPYIGPPTIAHYNYERTGRKIVWGHVMNVPTGSHSGAIDDYVKEGYRQRREIQAEINEMIKKVHADMEKQGFDESERPYWTDRGMAKMVSDKIGVFFVQYLSPTEGLPDVVFKDGVETNIEDL